MLENQIIAIGYNGESPFSGATISEYGGWRIWDIEHSKRDGWIRSNSGGGGGIPHVEGEKIWTPCWTVFRSDKQRLWDVVSSMNLIEKPFIPEEWDSYNFVDNCEEVDSTFYCNVCDDRMASDETCDHFLYVSGMGEVGVGDCELLTDKSYKSAMFRWLDKEPKARDEMINSIAGGVFPKMRFHGSILGPTLVEMTTKEGYQYDAFPDSYEYRDNDAMVGMAWMLTCCWGGTDEQKKMTFHWLREHKSNSVSKFVH